MPETVKVPVLGNVAKGNLTIGLLAGGGAAAYAWYKHEKSKKLAAASAKTASTANASAPYGYGAAGYGAYGYGYGANPSYGGYGYAGYSEITPYPQGQEYGYGAYGYGNYNPYTGQYLGGGTGTGTVTPVGGTGSTSTTAWAAQAATALEAQGYTASQVYQALGMYLTNLPLTSQEEQIVSEAVGAAGNAPGGPYTITSAPAPGQTGTTTASTTKTVPKVTGGTSSAAISRGEAAGFVVHSSAPKASTKVGSQTPRAGTVVTKGKSNYWPANSPAPLLDVGV